MDARKLASARKALGILKFCHSLARALRAERAALGIDNSFIYNPLL